MAIQRKNPLPIGRYWVDIIDTQTHPGNTLFFHGWLGANRSTVNVVKRENFGALWNALNRDWYLFDVTEPTKWDTTKGFGLPTIVELGAKPTTVIKPADTATNPETPGTSEMISDWLDQLKEGLGGARSALIIGGLIYVFFQMNGRRK